MQVINENLLSLVCGGEMPSVESPDPENTDPAGAAKLANAISTAAGYVVGFIKGFF